LTTDYADACRPTRCRIGLSGISPPEWSVVMILRVPDFPGNFGVRHRTGEFPRPLFADGPEIVGRPSVNLDPAGMASKPLTSMLLV